MIITFFIHFCSKKMFTIFLNGSQFFIFSMGRYIKRFCLKKDKKNAKHERKKCRAGSTISRIVVKNNKKRKLKLYNNSMIQFGTYNWSKAKQSRYIKQPDGYEFISSAILKCVTDLPFRHSSRVTIRQLYFTTESSPRDKHFCELKTISGLFWNNTFLNFSHITSKY